MAGKTTLERRLQDYDGVAVSILSEARIACRTAAGFQDDLIRLCCDQRPVIADGATWILKAELEAGVQLSAPLIDRLIASLDDVQSWPARLHLCQCIRHFHLSPGQAFALRLWLGPLLNHQRPFLRAWALDGLCHLPNAGQEPEILQHLDAMETDPAASVRARARALRKMFGTNLVK
ncbi:MAG: hypothetical protein P1V13_20365 [Rhizobiaceae bacterium]|nr:hypothetical protein [Rhizobiaceae bacterium]